MRGSGESLSVDRAPWISLSDATVGGDIRTDIYVLPESMRGLADQWRRARRVPRALDLRYEHQVAAWFVEPPGWARARSILQQQRVVLLQAAAGSGRRTAAVRLLGASAPSSGPIHELPVHEEELGESVLDEADVLGNDRLLLDLSLVGVDRLAAMHDDLAGFCGKVRDRSAFLVVVLPDSGERVLHAELSDLLLKVGRPDGVTVFRRHLARYDLEAGLPEPAPPELLVMLGRESMQDIANLARLVQEARARADASTPFHSWLGEALAAHGDQSAVAALQVAQQPGRSRALMLASALLEGLSADDVFQAERLLIRAVGYEDDQAHEFEEPDLRARLDEIGVEVRSDGRVRFRKLNYARAVRRHFWANFPSLRGGFGNWVVECGRRMRLAEDDAENLVSRYLDVCSWVGRPTDVTAAVETWASGGQREVPLALRALERGLADSREGWRFRQGCYWWSVDRGLPAPLAHIVIAACVDVIAPNHPQQAIVRLHHLLGPDHDDDVAQAARSALLRLAADRRVLRRLLARLVDPARSFLDHPRDRNLFLAVADPERLVTRSSSGQSLLAETGVRTAVVRGWAVVLRHSSEAEYDGPLQRWLESYTTHRVVDLVQVLVDAGHSEFAAEATLSTSAYRWLRETEAGPDAAARRDTVRRLIRAIDDAREPVALDNDRPD